MQTSRLTLASVIGLAGLSPLAAAAQTPLTVTQAECQQVIEMNPAYVQPQVLAACRAHFGLDPVSDDDADMANGMTVATGTNPTDASDMADASGAGGTPGAGGTGTSGTSGGTTIADVDADLGGTDAADATVSAGGGNGLNVDADLGGHDVVDVTVGGGSGLSIGIGQ